MFLEFQCRQISHDDLMKELPLKVLWRASGKKNAAVTRPIAVIKNYSAEHGDGNVRSS